MSGLVSSKEETVVERKQIVSEHPTTHVVHVLDNLFQARSSLVPVSLPISSWSTLTQVFVGIIKVNIS